MVERDFTLKTMKGSNHKHSLKPEELGLLVHKIRHKTELVIIKYVFENKKKTSWS